MQKHRSAALRKHSLGARLGARLLGWRLDHLLSTGTPVREGSALAVRAERLRKPSERLALATSIERAVADADRAPSRLSSRVPLNREAIRAQRAELASLAALLQSDPDCHAQGIARCRLLIHDGGSPLYGQAPESALAAALRDARTLLMKGGELDASGPRGHLVRRR